MPKKEEVKTPEATKEKVEELKEKITESKIEGAAPNEIDALKSELEKTKQELQQWQEEARTHQRNVSKKEEELKRQADIQSQIDELGAMQKIVIGALQERGVTPDDETLGEKRVDYLKQADDYLKQRQAKRAQDDYAMKAQYVFRRAQEVFSDNDAKLLRIERFLDRGMLEEAEGMVSKAETKKTPDTIVKEETKQVESEEQLRARIKEEVKKEIMKERGELDTETGQPAGASKTLTVEDVKKMSPAERAARASEIANLPLGAR